MVIQKKSLIQPYLDMTAIVITQFLLLRLPPSIRIELRRVDCLLLIS
jgi:hypothetical protein